MKREKQKQNLNIHLYVVDWTHEHKKMNIVVYVIMEYRQTCNGTEWIFDATSFKQRLKSGGGGGGGGGGGDYDNKMTVMLTMTVLNILEIMQQWTNEHWDNYEAIWRSEAAGNVRAFGRRVEKRNDDVFWIVLKEADVTTVVEVMI